MGTIDIIRAARSGRHHVPGTERRLCSSGAEFEEVDALAVNCIVQDPQNWPSTEVFHL